MKNMTMNENDGASAFATVLDIIARCGNALRYLHRTACM